MSVTRQSLAQKFREQKNAVLPPLPPFTDMKYEMRVQNDRWLAIKWSGNNREHWNLILNAIKALPERRYNGATKEWIIPFRDNYLQWAKVAGFPDPIIIAEQVQEFTEEEWEDPIESQKKLIADTQIDPERLMIPGLRPYQTDFVKYMIVRKGRAFLGDEQGTGKTISALAWLVYSDAYPALIVVNAPTKLQWYQQYHDWLKKTPGADYRCQILSGQKPYKLDQNVSCIINWDILYHWKDALAQFGFKYLVGDEVQAIGNPESKRAIAFRMLSKVIPECVCMSGTPARSKPAQFWTVLNIMMPAEFPNYYKYLYRYCEPKSTPWGMQFNGASHVQELHYKMSQCLLRRTKEEVMKWLPPKTMEVVPLEIDKTLENEYRDQEAEIYKEGTSDLHQRVADLMRTAYALKEKSLLRWVEDFLDSGNKLLLFAWHRDVVDLLVDSLKKYHPVKIYGGISVAAREAAKTAFIQDESCRVMVANIQAGGVGIDGLQKVCNHVAFAEFSHTPLDHRQAEDRLHRGGQDLPVTSYYLIAPGTVDDDSVEVLDDRAQMLDNALDGHRTADVNLIGEILERKGIKL